MSDFNRREFPAKFFTLDREYRLKTLVKSNNRDGSKFLHLVDVFDRGWREFARLTYTVPKHIKHSKESLTETAHRSQSDALYYVEDCIGWWDG